MTDALPYILDGSGIIGRLRYFLEDDSDDEGEESQSKRSRKLGRFTLRHGGFAPHKRQQPELDGMAAWRHQWWISKLWKLVSTKP